MSALEILRSMSSKPEKFTGENFYCWQQQMKFWLTELELFTVISGSKTEKKIAETTSKEMVEVDSSKTTASTKDDASDKDILCHGRILSALSDSIYRIFCHTKTASELWDALEKKYGSAEKGLSRYSCEKMIEFQMVDKKSMSDQIHEFENIVYDMKLKGIVVPDVMLVSFMISKLPPSWSDFARSLKHKPESFTLDDLLICLRIEDKHRLSQKNLQTSKFQANVHMVEGSSKSFSKPFNKFGANKNKSFKKPAFSKIKNNAHNNNNRPMVKVQGNETFCFVCGKANHVAKNCFQRRRQPVSTPRPEANVVTMGATSDSPSHRYHVTSPELNFVFNSNDWLIDSGANVHVCADKKLFSLYQESSTRTVSMGNGSLARVLGEGQVNLELSSRKRLVLNGVFHVSDLRRNLISASLLVQQGYKVVFESNRVVISKFGVFIGKGYICNGLFKLNVMHFPSNKNSVNSPMVVANVECSDSWHARLWSC